MTIQEAIYCMQSYLPETEAPDHCLECPYYGSKGDSNEQTYICKSSEAHRIAIEALKFFLVK